MASFENFTTQRHRKGMLLSVFVLISMYTTAESRYILIAPYESPDGSVSFRELPITNPQPRLIDYENEEVQSAQKRSGDWMTMKKKNYLDLNEVSAVLNEMIGRKGGAGGAGHSIKMKPVRFSLGG